MNKESWLQTEFKNFKQQQHIRAELRKLRRLAIQADRRALKEKQHQEAQRADLPREM